MFFEKPACGEARSFKNRACGPVPSGAGIRGRRLIEIICGNLQVCCKPKDVHEKWSSGNLLISKEPILSDSGRSGRFGRVP